MIRKLALASALLAASLSAGALSAQSTATTPKPAAAPAMKQTPAPAAKPATPATSARHAAWTKDQIKEAQEGLAKAGLYKGKATGVMNSKTRSALRAYQKENKLPVTGRLSDSVLVKLKST
jgi:peptidoglycan hydrolase-like protein with peptidoglycan-binding domain